MNKKELLQVLSDHRRFGVSNEKLADKILSLMGENKIRLTGASEGNKGTDNSK